jgi:hypothetical protein
MSEDKKAAAEMKLSLDEEKNLGFLIYSNVEDQYRKKSPKKF